MYCSIDIETTGLDPNKHQILEFAAVLWTCDDIMQCPYFYNIIIPKGDIIGEPYALIMNMRILKAIIAGNGVSLVQNFGDFTHWLEYNGINPHKKAYVIGKNFGNFDLQFLNKIPDWPGSYFHHRILDVGSLYATRDGIPSTDYLPKPPITEEPHYALHDARLDLFAVMKKLK